MNTEPIKQFFKSTGDLLVKKSPEILIGVGITGMISSTVMAVTATPKALILIEAEKSKKEVDILSAKDIVKVTWKCYIPAVATGILGAGCIIGSSAVSAKRNAALAAAYTLSESTLKEYQAKVVETIGEKKEHFVRDKISKDQIEKNPVQNNEVIITGKGTTLCYEAISGRYFQSDIDRIKKAVNEVNHQMLCDGYISLSDFYYEIGLAPTEMSERIGWKADDGLMDVYFSSQLSEDGTPCIVLNYEKAPNYNFNRF